MYLGSYFNFYNIFLEETFINKTDINEKGFQVKWLSSVFNQKGTCITRFKEVRNISPLKSFTWNVSQDTYLRG